MNTNRASWTHRQAGAAWPWHTSAWDGDNASTTPSLRPFHEYRPTASQTLPGPPPPADSVSLKEGRLAKQRTRATLLGLVAVSVVATAVIVHGSGPSVHFRIGERPDRELRVNVKEFKLRNQTKTSNERQAAADQVPPSMVNDPGPIRELAERLDDLTTAVAKSARFEDLRENVRAAWKLKPESYLDLKAATDTPERRDNLHAQIAAAFAAACSATASSGPAPCRPTKNRAGCSSIRKAGEPPDRRRLVPRERVVPERIVKPDGPVYQEFCSAFTSPRVGQILFGLIADQLDSTPTLDLRGRGHRPASRRGAEPRPRPLRHLHAAARCWSSRARRSARSSSSCSVSSTTRPWPSSASATGPGASSGSSPWSRPSTSWPALTSAGTSARFAREPGRVAMICGLVILALAVVRLLAAQTWNAEVVPVAIAAMIVAIAYNPSFAMMVTFGLSLLTCIALGTEIPHFLVVMGGTAAGVLTLSEVRTRTKLIKVGATAALTYFLMTWATGSLAGPAARPGPQRQLLARGLGADGRLLPGREPAVHRECPGDRHGHQPARAGRQHPSPAPGAGPPRPGHAQPLDHRRRHRRVGGRTHRRRCPAGPHRGLFPRHRQDAQAALLRGEPGRPDQPPRQARPGDEHADHHRPRQGRGRPGPAAPPARADHRLDRAAPRHDAGRVLLPRGQPAQRQQPRRLAGRRKLPTAIPGPKPQTKEAAILMVADAVESASRTLSDPTPARLEGLVSDLIDKRLRDGQFDECGLTLREIAEIRDSLIKSLIGIYHGRVKYPEHRTA